METSTLAMIKKFREIGITWFTITDFARILGIRDQNTVYKKIQRLEKKAVIKKLIKGKYIFLFGKINDFAMANFYISHHIFRWSRHCLFMELLPVFLIK